MTHYGSLSDLHTIVERQYNEELYFNQIAYVEPLLKFAFNKQWRKIMLILLLSVFLSLRCIVSTKKTNVLLSLKVLS